MKVSTKLFNQQQLKQFTSLNEEIQKTQNKISTGKKHTLALMTLRVLFSCQGYKLLETR